MKITHTDFQVAPHPLFDRAKYLAHSNFRAFADILTRSKSSLGGSWIRDFESLLEHLFASDALLSDGFSGYVKFAIDSVRHQSAFEKSGTYRGSVYAEASKRVYQNDEYMMSEYLPGLLLSHFLWPHHFRQLMFFDNAFVSQIKDGGICQFVEVGVGTGLYSRRLLEAIPRAVGVGYEVSPSAKTFALRHISAHGLGDRYSIRLQDIVAEPPSEQFAALVCVEVLEHLERPVEFLCALRAILAPGGRAFISAAVSADHVDHIHLYATAADVEVHLLEAGFAIEQSFAARAYPARYANQPVPVAAAFIAV